MTSTLGPHHNQDERILEDGLQHAANAETLMRQYPKQEGLPILATLSSIA